MIGSTGLGAAMSSGLTTAPCLYETLDVGAGPFRRQILFDQWFFGRLQEIDLRLLVRDLVTAGLADADPQAALEAAFGIIIVDAHGAALDDSAGEVDVAGPTTLEEQAAMVSALSKLARLRLPRQVVETEMRSWGRGGIAAILAGPPPAEQIALEDLFNQMAIQGHNVALDDALRDIGPDHPEPGPAAVLAQARAAVEQQRFSGAEVP
jgi:hypothetical protein